MNIQVSNLTTSETNLRMDLVAITWTPNRLLIHSHCLLWIRLRNLVGDPTSRALKTRAPREKLTKNQSALASCCSWRMRTIGECQKFKTTAMEEQRQKTCKKINLQTSRHMVKKNKKLCPDSQLLLTWAFRNVIPLVIWDLQVVLIMASHM